MGVHRYLVTAPVEPRLALWTATALYTNWIEGRPRGRDRETWLVTCFDEESQAFLEAARAAGVTVEEIAGAGGTETYLLRVGEPGTGWAREASP